MTGSEIQQIAWNEFEYWLSNQPDEIQELEPLEQIELYIKEQGIE